MGCVYKLGVFALVIADLLGKGTTTICLWWPRAPSF
jgi:hypothetical protein